MRGDSGQKVVFEDCEYIEIWLLWSGDGVAGLQVDWLKIQLKCCQYLCFNLRVFSQRKTINLKIKRPETTKRKPSGQKSPLQFVLLLQKHKFKASGQESIQYYKC